VTGADFLETRAGKNSKGSGEGMNIMTVVEQEPTASVGSIPGTTIQKKSSGSETGSTQPSEFN
jgi:hypothetical protein